MQSKSIQQAHDMWTVEGQYTVGHINHCFDTFQVLFCDEKTETGAPWQAGASNCSPKGLQNAV
eukprot:3785339-Pyramimonas_sp.AAC.1